MSRHGGWIALAWLSLATAAAARDGDFQAMTPLARLHEGIPHRIASVPPYAYLALDSGLAVYDLSDPLRPARVSHLYLPSPVYDIKVEGARLYLANGESGLAVVDVADPARPVLVGQLATSGTRAVWLAGSVAYLAETSEPEAPVAVFGLRTVDVSVAADPRPLGFLAMPNGALDVAVEGTVAFVALGSELALPHGLYAVDVANPALPAAIAGGVVATGKAVHGVVVSGGVAYLATGFPSTGSVVIADISAPGAPRELARVALSDGAYGLALSGSTLLVAARALGLLALDVSDPQTPVLLDALPTGRETVAVASAPGLALLAERSSIERAAFTLADATFPAALRLASRVSFAEATATAAAPARGYFLERDALWIADTASPGLPSWLGTWSPPRGDFSALAVAGALAAVSEGDLVHLVDLTDPALPLGRGDARLSAGVAVRPVLAGNTLYVVNGHGFESFDITSPGAPAPLSSFATDGWSSSLALDGSLGYLVAGSTLHVLDLGVSTMPVEIGSLTLPGEALYGVDVRGPLAVATGYGASLHVFDVTRPSSPVRIATLSGSAGFDVRLAGDRAVIAAGTAGVLVVDLSVPASPRLEGFYDTSGSAVSLSIDGQDLYLASNEAQHWLLRCDTCAAACTDTWPVVLDNSFLGVRAAGGATFSWKLASGSGEFNLHRTTVKSDLTLLYTDPSTLVGTTAALSLGDLFAPGAGQCGYYKIYPRASCSGASVGP